MALSSCPQGSNIQSGYLHRAFKELVEEFIDHFYTKEGEEYVFGKAGDVNNGWGGAL